MSQFKQPYFTIRIEYENDDELVHTGEHPYCTDRSCPCHAERATAPMWTGAMMSIDRSITKRQKAVKQQGEPTVELEKWHGPISDVVDREGKTWRVGSIQRRRITLWHRLKHWFSR